MAHPDVTRLVFLLEQRRANPRSRHAPLTPRQMYWVQLAGHQRLLSRDERLIALRLGNPTAEITPTQAARLRQLGHPNLLTVEEVTRFRLQNPGADFTVDELVRLRPEGLMPILNSSDTRVREQARLALERLLEPGSGENGERYFETLADQLYATARAEGLNEVFRERERRRLQALVDARAGRRGTGAFLGANMDPERADAMSHEMADTEEREFIRTRLAAEIADRGASRADLIRTFRTAFGSVFDRPIAQPPPGTNAVVALLEGTIARDAPVPIYPDGTPVDTVTPFTPASMARTVEGRDIDGRSWRMAGGEWMLAVLNHPDPAIRGRYRGQLARMALQTDAQLTVLARQIHAATETEIQRVVNDRMRQIEAGLTEQTGADAFRGIFQNSDVLPALRRQIEQLARHELVRSGGGSEAVILHSLRALRSSLADVSITSSAGTTGFGDRMPRYDAVMADLTRARQAAMDALNTDVPEQDRIPVFTRAQQLAAFDGLANWIPAPGSPPNYAALEMRVWIDIREDGGLNPQNFFDRLFRSLSQRGIQLGAQERAEYMESLLKNPRADIQVHLLAAAATRGITDLNALAASFPTRPPAVGADDIHATAGPAWLYTMGILGYNSSASTNATRYYGAQASGWANRTIASLFGTNPTAAPPSSQLAGPPPQPPPPTPPVAGQPAPSPPVLLALPTPLNRAGSPPQAGASVTHPTVATASVHPISTTAAPRPFTSRSLPGYERISTARAREIERAGQQFADVAGIPADQRDRLPPRLSLLAYHLGIDRAVRLYHLAQNGGADLRLDQLGQDSVIAQYQANMQAVSQRTGRTTNSLAVLATADYRTRHPALRGLTTVGDVVYGPRPQAPTLSASATPGQ
jgi:hypothetical protein